MAAGTGLAYGFVRWFGERVGEFGPEPHPWQGGLQHLHVLSVPALVFALGWVTEGHAMRGLRSGSRLMSGLGLLALILPMVLSGYGIQVATSPTTQLACRWIHGCSSGLFLLVSGFHLWVGLRRGRSRG